MSGVPSIPDFYKNREIFITGGTGFIGKALIEKLLRSCPHIGKIYILVRQKKGATLDERIETLKSNSIFKKLHATKPNSFNKIVPIEGNVTEMRLGISSADLKRLENVSIIVHASASVRFDDPLRDAIFVNVRSTRELLNLALQLKHLEVFMHISTAFCNCDHKVIEERIYPAHADWATMIRLAETMDSYVLDTLAPKLMDSLVNTYLFTKGLAENMCKEYEDRLPIVIFRPAIVTGAEVEPIPGWVDNLNGIMGLGIANGLGILRSMYCYKNAELHCTPVDTSVRGIIVAAWKKVVLDKSNEILIYNSSNGTTTITEISKMTESVKFKFPLSQSVWNPSPAHTSCLWNYKMQVIFFHFLPAVLVDLFLPLVSTTNLSLVKIHRKIAHAQLALRHFMTNQWIIKTDNYKGLTQFIKDQDMNSFSVSSDAVKNRLQYVRDQALHARRYIMNEPDENIPAAIRRMYILTALDFTLKKLFWVVVAYNAYFWIL